MIDETWKRVCGMHVEQNGNISLVWLAHDTEADVIHLYDTASFKREVLAVIAEGINARGRYIPVAWNNEKMAEELLQRGCRMEIDKADDSDEMAEVLTRDIWERMRTDRWKVDKRLSDWLSEFRTFNREADMVPRETHPLMAATRHAMSCLQFARSPYASRKATKNYAEHAQV